MGGEWKEMTLGEVVRLGNGHIQTGPFGSQLHASDYVEDGIPCIMPANIHDGRVSLDGIARISKKDAERLSKHLVKLGDIIYSRRGDVTRNALIGESEVGMFCGTGCLLVRPGSAVDSKFLAQHLSTPWNKEWIIQHAIGATMPNLNTGILSDIPLSIPPLPEQHAIAHILGSLDDKIALNRKQNATLEAMAQALFQSWFVDFDPVIDKALAAGQEIPEPLAAKARRRAALGDRRKPLPPAVAALFPDRFVETEEMGWVPEGWEVGRLDHLLVLQRGFDLPKTTRNAGNIPLIASSGQDGFHSESRVSGPGVVTGRSGKIGVVTFVQQDFWPLNTTLWVKSFPRSNPHHAYFVLQMIDLDGFSTGSAVPTLNRNHVHGHPMILPPRRLIDKFGEITRSKFEKMNQNHIQIESLIALRDTLLPKLISGELRLVDV